MAANGRAVRGRAERGGKAAHKAAGSLPASAKYMTGRTDRSRGKRGAVWRGLHDRDWYPRRLARQNRSGFSSEVYRAVTVLYRDRALLESGG
jgi:hypothetical protein